MNPTERRVVRFARELFEHGLEGYDKDKAADPVTKGVTNPGGGKMFIHYQWRNAEKSNISIQNPLLAKALAELPCFVGTLNRIQLDEAGKPVLVKSTNGEPGYNRTHTGLFVYGQLDEDPNCGVNIRARILEVLKPTGDLSSYIEVASNLDANTQKCISEFKYQNFARELVDLRPSACVILALPSGPAGGGQFWSYTNKKAASRANMARSSAAPAGETGDIPF